MFIAPALSRYSMVQTRRLNVAFSGEPVSLSVSEIETVSHIIGLYNRVQQQPLANDALLEIITLGSLKTYKRNHHDRFPNDPLLMECIQGMLRDHLFKFCMSAPVTKGAALGELDKMLQTYRSHYRWDRDFSALRPIDQLLELLHLIRMRSNQQVEKEKVFRWVLKGFEKSSLMKVKEHADQVLNILGMLVNGMVAKEKFEEQLLVLKKQREQCVQTPLPERVDVMGRHFTPNDLRAFLVKILNS